MFDEHAGREERRNSKEHETLNVVLLLITVKLFLSSQAHISRGTERIEIEVDSGLDDAFDCIDQHQEDYVINELSFCSIIFSLDCL